MKCLWALRKLIGLIDMITKEQIAHNIVKEVSTLPNMLEYEAMTLCATKMAEWKDEQEIEFLQSLMFQSATQNIFDRIKQNCQWR